MTALLSNLQFAYRLIQASEGLLVAAIQRAEGDYKVYLEKHLEEERGHELMLERDLNAMDCFNIPLSYTAACLAGAQYYFIQHEGPDMLLGYMLAMEERSPSKEYIAQAEALAGVELTCLRHHAEHDPQHMKDLLDQICKLEAPRRRLVEWNLGCTRMKLQYAAETFYDKVAK